MKRNILILLTLGLLVVLGNSCTKEISAPNSSELKATSVPAQSKDMQVSRSFQFSTVNDLPITITALDNQNLPLANVRFNILTDYRKSGEKLFFLHRQIRMELLV